MFSYIKKVFVCKITIQKLKFSQIMTKIKISHLTRKSSQKELFFTILIIACLFLHPTLSNEISTDMNHEAQSSGSNKIKIDGSEIKNQKENEGGFHEFIKRNDNVVIYFNAKDCEFCNEFHQTFVEIEKIYRSRNPSDQKKLEFGAIELNQKTQSIFKNFNIDAVPELKFFYKGNISQYSYLFNQYNKKSAQNHLNWIQRVSKLKQFQQKVSQTHRLSIFGNSNKLKQSFYIPEISSLQDAFKQLNEQQINRLFVFNCSYQEKQSQNKELAVFLKNTYLGQLKEHFFCTQNHSLLHAQNPIAAKNNNQLFMNVYGFNEQNNKAVFKQKISLENKLHESAKNQEKVKANQNSYLNMSEVYHLNFLNYLNKHLQYWTQKATIQVFSKNYSGFVFIMNNETRSKALYQTYKQIKTNLNSISQYALPKFYFSDLSSTPQQTTRIKKYLFGIQISIKHTYPYPILAYVKPGNDYVKKYIFPLDQQLTSQSMKQWIVKVLQEVEKHESVDLNKVQTQKQTNDQSVNENIAVHEYFRTTPQELFPTRYINSFFSIYYNNTYTLPQKQQKLQIPQKFFNNHREIHSVNFNDFQILLSPIYQEPFFIFINCRNDFKSYQLYTEIIEWIQEDEEQSDEEQEQAKQQPKHTEQKVQKTHQQPQMTIANEPQQTTLQPHPFNQQERILTQIQGQNPQKVQQQTPKNQEQMEAEKALKQKQAEGTEKQTLKQKELFSLLNFYLLNFNNNDYPPIYTDSDGTSHELKVEYFPSVLYFSKDKKLMKKLEGVQNIDQIKQFVTNQLLKNDALKLLETNKKPQQIKKANDKGQSDRELEGQVLQNIEKLQN